MVSVVRRALVALAIVFALSQVGYAALPTTTTWEVRTLGNFSNGGCYVTGSSGTDFSQQNAAQYSFTDLVITGTNTIVTSASHSFVATDVGNCMHVTAGTNFTPGFYQIVSVSTGAATLDRAVGTAGSTNGTYAVGGAVALPSTACTAMNNGNVIYVKADGTYTVTSSCTLIGGGSPTTGVMLLGYNATRGDNGKVTWTTSTNSVDLINNSGALLGATIRNFTFTNTAATKGMGMNMGTCEGVYVGNSSFDGFNKGIVYFAGTGNVFDTVEVKNSTNEGIRFGNSNNNTNGAFFNVWSHANGGDGLDANGADAQMVTVVDSVFSNNGGNGIQSAPQSGTTGGSLLVLDGVVLYTNALAGVTQTSTMRQTILVANSIIYGNTGVGINGGATNPPSAQGAYSNAYGSNTGGNRSNFNAGVGDVALTANPFKNPAAGDFTLNSTAGGGALLKGTGFPGVSLFGTGHLDIGPLQSGSTGGGQMIYGGAN